VAEQPQAVTAEDTSEAMDSLAEQMDKAMARLERAGMDRCPPKLNPKGGDPNSIWMRGAPWKKAGQ
jgi:glycerol transport system substrate-binding protein